LPTLHAEGDLRHRPAGVVRSLRAARIWQHRERDVDVLCGDPAARGVLRFLFHDRAVVHRPGSSTETPWHGAGTAGVSDIWRRHVYRLGIVRPHSGFLHNYEWRPQLDGLLAGIRI